MKYMLLIYGAKTCWAEDNGIERMDKALAIASKLSPASVVTVKV